MGVHKPFHVSMIFNLGFQKSAGASSVSRGWRGVGLDPGALPGCLRRDYSDAESAT